MRTPGSNGPDFLPALIERSMLSLRSMVGLLDAEHAALRRGDAIAVKHLSEEKSAGLLSLSALLAQLRLQPWPAHLPANDLLALLERCQEQNRTNGLLMNLPATPAWASPTTATAARAQPCCAPKAGRWQAPDPYARVKPGRRLTNPGFHPGYASLKRAAPTSILRIILNY